MPVPQGARFTSRPTGALSALYAPGGKSRLHVDTERAAGLGIASMAANFVGLIFTVVFARLLGAPGYGSLAALVAAFLILSIAGSALQITIAREISGQAGISDRALGRTVSHWINRVLAMTVLLAGVSILLRNPIAALIGVEDLPWAAAAVLPSGCAWLLVSTLRGVLQGLQRYAFVGLSIAGEAVGRLVVGLVLVAVGLDVTGAFLGTGLSLFVTALVLHELLHRVLAPSGSDRSLASPRPLWRLRDLGWRTWAPVLALSLIAFLQNVDVILVKHLADDDVAGSYAADAVAAKVIIWLAIGLGIYLLPEAARRTAASQDARPVLYRALGLVALAGLPMIAIYAVAGRPLLELVFGEDFALASDALPLLGIAMTLLASTYLCSQHLIALRVKTFLWFLALAAAAEPLLLVWVGAEPTSVALMLLGLQAVLAAAMLAASTGRAGGVPSASSAMAPFRRHAAGANRTS
jgi:O-antigen/teichoic acid export membrane protein